MSLGILILILYTSPDKKNVVFFKIVKTVGFFFSLFLKIIMKTSKLISNYRERVTFFLFSNDKQIIILTILFTKRTFTQKFTVMIKKFFI